MINVDPATTVLLVESRNALAEAALGNFVVRPNVEENPPALSTCREETPFLSSARTVCALLLTDKLREPLIWIFGSDPEVSDFQLATDKVTGVSGRHFCITYNWDSECLLLFNLSRHHTFMRSSKLGENLMVRDSSIIPSGENITIEAGIVSLSIYMPERGSHRDTFDKALRRALAVVEPAGPRIATFGFDRHLKETPLAIPGKRDGTHYLIKEEGDIGKGTFGTVSKALDYVTGNLYAAKRFVRSEAKMEIHILKTLSHVSLLFVNW